MQAVTDSIMPPTTSPTSPSPDPSREGVPAINVLPVIESDTEEDGLEMPTRVHPWLAKTSQEPTPLTSTKAPQGSPIEEESETEYGSDSDGNEDDDYAIADDDDEDGGDDEDVWMDSASGSLEDVGNRTAPLEYDLSSNSLTFERLPKGAYELRKSASMLSLAFRGPAVSGKPPMSRTKPSRPSLPLRRMHTADGHGARSHQPHHAAVAHSTSTRFSGPAQQSPQPDCARVPSDKEVRRRMLGCELTDEDRRNLDLERRWPWGRGIRSAASVRNQEREQEILSEMFSKAPQQEPTLRSWGYPLGQESEEQTAPEEGKLALLFKCPTCSW
ncbi:hypothetical protein GQ53DRAFT_401582 [Thozetella sp. PMI_491]|nr:hypothetical protein GQ53DRAFT_401582 [Thozetella sp. PMI_491]